MKITEYGSIRSAADIKRKRRAGAAAASFADVLSAAGETASASAVSDVSAPAQVDNILSLQEISEEEAHRRQLIQKGEQTLDSLDKLRRQLLAGAIPYATLKELQSHISVQRHTVTDPRLLGIMDEIELRAAVELAKLEMSRASRAEEP